MNKLIRYTCFILCFSFLMINNSCKQITKVDKSINKIFRSQKKIERKSDKYKKNLGIEDDNSDENLNDVVKNLLYKFPTRGRITRARYEMQGAGEQNVKTSIYNKKANTIKDE